MEQLKKQLNNLNKTLHQNIKHIKDTHGENFKEGVDAIKDKSIKVLVQFKLFSEFIAKYSSGVIHEHAENLSKELSPLLKDIHKKSLKVIEEITLKVSESFLKFLNESNVENWIRTNLRGRGQLLLQLIEKAADAARRTILKNNPVIGLEAIRSNLFKSSRKSRAKRSRKSRAKRSRKSRAKRSRKSVSKLTKKILYAFTNDYDKNTFIYTYAKKIPAKDASKVIKAIKKAMKGFLNVIVKHIKDNKYELSTTGPDQNTSNELKKLAQLGEYTKYTVKMAKGNNWWV
jgi:hypothetical protein